MNIRPRSISYFLSGMSLQHKLPLLICSLLSCVILAFGLISYYGVKKVSTDLGEKRLHTLAKQIRNEVYTVVGENKNPCKPGSVNRIF